MLVLRQNSFEINALEVLQKLVRSYCTRTTVFDSGNEKTEFHGMFVAQVCAQQLWRRGAAVVQAFVATPFVDEAQTALIETLHRRCRSLHACKCKVLRYLVIRGEMLLPQTRSG